MSVYHKAFSLVKSKEWCGRKIMMLLVVPTQWKKWYKNKLFLGQYSLTAITFVRKCFVLVMLRWLFLVCDLKHELALILILLSCLFFFYFKILSTLFFCCCIYVDWCPCSSLPKIGWLHLFYFLRPVVQKMDKVIHEKCSWCLQYF